jgi:AraC family transcriptional activator of pobA
MQRATPRVSPPVQAAGPPPGVPTYGLYGESLVAPPDFWIHAETIASRSRLHNWEIRRHRHDHFFQILQIRAGDGDALLDTETLRLMPGTVVTIPPGIAHGFRFSPEIDGHVVTMLAGRVRQRPAWNPDVFDRPRLLRVAPEPEGHFLLATLDRMEAELSTGFAPRTLLLESCLDVALTLAAARIGADPGSRKPDDRDRLARLNALIGLHYREHRPAAFYAEALGISVTHVNRLCRAATGRSLGTLLAQRLIDEARRNLVFSIMTVQQIAYELGYADPAYFSRAFTRATGETPGAFRRRERAGREQRGQQ